MIFKEILVGLGTVVLIFGYAIGGLIHHGIVTSYDSFGFSWGQLSITEKFLHTYFWVITTAVVIYTLYVIGNQVSGIGLM